MTAIRAVLFDAVGTVIHLREPVGDTYARAAQAEGMELSAERASAIFPAVLRSMPSMVFADRWGEALRDAEREWWHTVVARVFAAAGAAASGPAFERCFDTLFAHYGTAAAWQNAPDAATTLAALRERGLCTGVVSNFDYRLRAVLDGLALAPLLDLIVLPADAGAAKPDPRIFAFALKELGLRPAEAVYVGDDADHDIAGARAAGLRAIDVANGLEAVGPALAPCAGGDRR